MLASSRRNARVIAFQVIYQRAKIGVRHEIEKLLFKQIGFSKNYSRFSRALINAAWREKDEIDRVVQLHLINWKQKRISETLKALLRISVAELLFFPKTDAKIVLNEAIDICREYVGEKATKICNGTLHAIWQYRNVEAAEKAGGSAKAPAFREKPARRLRNLLAPLRKRRKTGFKIRRWKAMRKRELPKLLRKRLRKSRRKTRRISRF